MAKTLEIKYFNSFWIKKVCPKLAAANENYDGQTPSGAATANDVDWYNGNISGFWPGLPWRPKGISGDGVSATGATPATVQYPVFPWFKAPIYGGAAGDYAKESTINFYGGTGGNANRNDAVSFGSNWYIEEATHKGGFNNNRCSLGVRAYTVLDNPEGIHRSQTLIHSGVLNTRTGYNETNVFSVAEDIEKDMDAINGSIQKLYTENTNLHVFQERKINKVLINKNVLYSGTQGSRETGRITFFGQESAYAGEYGISKNPESFAVYGYRKYFTDRDRGVVCRLSMDGITEISDYGMTDYFRDNLASVSSNLRSSTNTITGLTYTSTGASQVIDLSIPKTKICDSGGGACVIPIGAKLILSPSGGAAPVPPVQIITRYVSKISEDPNNASNYLITLDSPFADNTLANPYQITITIFDRDRIVGGWDIYNKNYTVSLQKTPSTIYSSTQCLTTEHEYSTLNFDETVRGWVSFYSYRPLFMGSLKNYFYTFKYTNLYQHYVGSPTVNNNYGKFYGATTPAESSITFIFNPLPNVTKNFKTISYEGSNGWEMQSAYSDFQEFDRTNPDVLSPSSSFTYGTNYRDSAAPVKSLDTGIYIDSFGYPANAGFTLKENRYVADLVSNNVNPRPAEVIYPLAVYPNMSAQGQANTNGMLTGIKGYVSIVKLKLDNVTQPGGRKELFSVSSEYVMSSR